MGLTLKEP